MLGLGELDDPGTMRQLLTDRLLTLTEALPPDLAKAIRAALALDAAVTDRFLKDRVDRYARDIDRDPRTAKRRVEEGLRLLAELIARSQPADPSADPDNAFAPDGWEIIGLTATLLLDRDPPQLYERRRIVATRNGLDQIVVSLSAPPAADEGRQRPIIRLDMLDGGTIVEEVVEPGGHYRGTVRLPHALAAGEEHEYSFTFSTHARRFVRPYYALTPFRRCRWFRLTVRFGPEVEPGPIRRLNGVPPRILTEAAGEELAPDPHGAVEAYFTNLRAGLSYGICWANRDTTPVTAYDTDG